MLRLGCLAWLSSARWLLLAWEAPDHQLTWFDEIEQQKQVCIHSMAAGERSMLFVVPGASTPPSVAQPPAVEAAVPVPPESWCSSTMAAMSEGLLLTVLFISFLHDLFSKFYWSVYMHNEVIHMTFLSRVQMLVPKTCSPACTEFWWFQACSLT